MSKLLLVLLSTCAQCSAQAPDAQCARLQVETAASVTGISEKLDDFREATKTTLLEVARDIKKQEQWLAGPGHVIGQIMIAAVDFNKTLETVLQRQAASSALKIFQFVLVIVCFIVLAIVAICKCVKKNRLEQQEIEMEMIERKLQERREQCKSAARAAAAKATFTPTPTPK